MCVDNLLKSAAKRGSTCGRGGLDNRRAHPLYLGGGEEACKEVRIARIYESRTEGLIGERPPIPVVNRSPVTSPNRI